MLYMIHVNLLSFFQIETCIHDMSHLVFQDQQEFIQAAFNKVAQIVSEHGQPCLDSFVPAFSTENCLEHLALVASEWSYDYTFIDAHVQIYKTTNQEFKDSMGDC